MARHEDVPIRGDGKLAHQSDELPDMTAVDLVPAKHVGQVVDHGADRSDLADERKQRAKQRRGTDEATAAVGKCQQWIATDQRKNVQVGGDVSEMNTVMIDDW